MTLESSKYMQQMEIVARDFVASNELAGWAEKGARIREKILYTDDPLVVLSDARNFLRHARNDIKAYRTKKYIRSNCHYDIPFLYDLFRLQGETREEENVNVKDFLAEIKNARTTIETMMEESEVGIGGDANPFVFVQYLSDKYKLAALIHRKWAYGTHVPVNE